jgi:hypothetical protein
MMSKKGLVALLSISMLAALPGCCGNWGCGKDKDRENREDRKERKHKKMEKTTRSDGNGYRKTTRTMEEEK